jgi:adenylate cyclase
MMRLFKSHAFRLIMLRVIIGLLVTAGIFFDSNKLPQQRAVARVEDNLYDYRLRLAQRSELYPSVVILDIDEKSQAQEGQWPWGRNKLAALLDQLFDHYGVAVLGFDVVFAEPDRSSGLDVLRRLSENELKDVAAYRSILSDVSPKLDYNNLFASKLKSRNAVLGFVFLDDEDPNLGTKAWTLPPPVFPASELTGNIIPYTYKGYVANLTALQTNAASGGFFSTNPDSDGVMRRVPILVQYQNNYYESLPLAMVRSMMGGPQLIPRFSDSSLHGDGEKSVESIDIEGGVRIPVDESLAALIPYRGKEGSFPYYSISDALQGKLQLADLQNKIVLVGTRTVGLKDLRSTPMGPTYPGVEIHANMIAGMLEGKIWQSSVHQQGVERILILVMGIGLSILLPLLSPLRSSLLTIGVLALVAGINYYAWQYEYSVIPLAASLILISFLFLFNMSYGFFVETRRTRQITEAFGQYVAPERVQELSDNPDSLSMDGVSREMSVLFSDVRGFTRLSEGLQPKELTSLMNAYLTPMTQIVQKHRGTIDKYIGDALMAFWGAPLPDEKHAENSVRAAMDMLQRLDSLNLEFAERGWPPIEVGFGINTGIMNVGDMGSEFRRAYTVMGDSVNLGSRLEGLTKDYGVPIIVGEVTRQAIPNMLFRELDKVRVKGKQEPVTIYQPLGDATEVAPALAEQTGVFHEVLLAYRATNWDVAESHLRALLLASPGELLYELYLKRIAQYRTSPPPVAWDGIFTFETK